MSGFDNTDAYFNSGAQRSGTLRVSGVEHSAVYYLENDRAEGDQVVDEPEAEFSTKFLIDTNAQENSELVDPDLGLLYIIEILPDEDGITTVFLSRHKK